MGFIKEKASRIDVFYALFLLISFFGWLLEEVFFFLRENGFADRGFLSLPLSTVYGIGILLSYFLFGLPNRFRFFFFSFPTPKTCKQKLTQTILYVVLCGAVCTVCELLNGLILYGLFGFFMWDYRKIPFHYGPHICAPFALIWGILAFFFLRYFFLYLLRLFVRINRETLFAVLLPLSLFLLLDLSMNCTYAFFYRVHMPL